VCQAGHDRAGNWIGNGHEDNGYGLGRLLGGKGGECASRRQDDISLERSQFGREVRQPLKQG